MCRNFSPCGTFFTEMEFWLIFQYFLRFFVQNDLLMTPPKIVKMTSFDVKNQFPHKCSKWAKILTHIVKFDENAKKVLEKSLWRHYYVILADFCKQIKHFDSFIFTADLAKKIRKNYVTMRKFLDLWTTNIFYNFWPSFSPPFFGKLCHFSFFTCFVLEVPENQWFLQFFFENARKSEIWHLGGWKSPQKCKIQLT